MSLIADALKKAQSSKLGRRYLTPEPTGVLPVAREAQGRGGQVLWGSLTKVRFSPTLLAGIGSSLFLFVVLLSYFFYGKGVKAKSPRTPSPPTVEKKLMLTPPPVVPQVEPLALEKESGLAAERPTPGEEKRPSSQPGLESRAVARSTGKRPVLKPAIKTKTREAPGRGEGSKVSVAPDFSEEVRYHFNLALFYHEEKNFPQARREYEKVVQMWPLYPEAHNNLGIVYKELSMYDEALAQIKKAIALNPRYTRAYHNLGVIFQLKGDFKQATKNYLVAISQDSKHLGSYNNLGLVYRGEKRLHEARDLLEKALTIDSSYPQTHYNLALVLEETGDVEQARFHYQKFLDLYGEGDSRLAETVRAHMGRLRPKK